MPIEVDSSKSEPCIIGDDSLNLPIASRKEPQAKAGKNHKLKQESLLEGAILSMMLQAMWHMTHCRQGIEL